MSQSISFQGRTAQFILFCPSACFILLFYVFFDNSVCNSAVHLLGHGSKKGLVLSYSVLALLKTYV